MEIVSRDRGPCSIRAMAQPSTEFLDLQARAGR
jgi:hypothetical protein